MSSDPKTMVCMVGIAITCRKGGSCALGVATGRYEQLTGTLRAGGGQARAKKDGTAARNFSTANCRLAPVVNNGERARTPPSAVESSRIIVDATSSDSGVGTPSPPYSVPAEYCIKSRFQDEKQLPNGIQRHLILTSTSRVAAALPG